MTCTFCTERAGTHRLKARIWAKGHQRLPNTAALMDLMAPGGKNVGAICEPCGKATIAAGPRQFFGDGLVINNVFKALGKLPPDLDGAEIYIEPIAAEAKAERPN